MDNYGTQIDAFMAEVPANVQVVWLTIDLDRDYTDALNVMLATKAATYANTTVLDWKSFAAAHQSEWKVSDGIHYNTAGYEA